MDKEIIVGVDIGGTSIEAGCIVNKKMEKLSLQPTGAHRGKEEILNTLYETIEQVLLPGTLAIGVGVPGLLDAEKGEILNISNIPSWNQLPLKEALEKRFKLPVFVNNDANCFALGEKHFGKGQPYKNMVAIALGTGVGGGVIIQDKLYPGMFGGAGEVGMWPYKDATFEMYCGSAYFIKKHHATGKELYDMALAGDLSAQEIFNDFGTNIGKLVKNILYILAPDAIILGGSISQSFSLFEAGMKRELSDFPFEAIKKKIVIEQSQLNNIATLGAAGLYYNGQALQMMPSVFEGNVMEKMS